MQTVAIRQELFTARDGNPSARVISEEFTRLLHSAERPAEEREWFAALEIWGNVLIAAGTGLGYHLEFLNKLKQAPLLLLCDAFTENLEQTRLRLANYPAPVICLHPGNRSALAMLLRPHRVSAIPRLQILRHPAAVRYCTELVDQVVAFFNRTHSPGKKTPAAPVAIPFGNHFLQQELVHGLRDLGLEALPIPQEAPGLFRENSLAKMFQEQRPQALISVNGKGLDREGIVSGICRWLNIPVHVWFVDDPRPILLAYPREQWPHHHYWCWEKAYLPWLRNQGLSSQWLPLAGDPHLFFPSTRSPDLDLLFTGSAMGNAFLNTIRSRYMHTPELEFQARQLAPRILSREIQPQDLPGVQVPGLDRRNAAWFSSLAIHMASQTRRRNWLTLLMDSGLCIAGDPEGWHEVLGDHVRALPDIDYRQGLREHYQRSNLHINITSCQMPSAINQRAFDIALSGRFALHDNQDDLRTLFPPDSFVQADSPEHMADLVHFYRSHPAEAQSIASKARQHILGNHTYAHRLKILLGIP